MLPKLSLWSKKTSHGEFKKNKIITNYTNCISQYNLGFGIRLSFCENEQYGSIVDKTFVVSFYTEQKLQPQNIVMTSYLAQYNVPVCQWAAINYWTYCVPRSHWRCYILQGVDRLHILLIPTARLLSGFCIMKRPLLFQCVAGTRDPLEFLVAVGISLGWPIFDVGASVGWSVTKFEANSSSVNAFRFNR